MVWLFFSIFLFFLLKKLIFEINQFFKQQILYWFISFCIILFPIGLINKIRGFFSGKLCIYSLDLNIANIFNSSAESSFRIIHSWLAYLSTWSIITVICNHHLNWRYSMMFELCNSIKRWKQSVVTKSTHYFATS